jgi:hypothetical protein
MTVTFFFKAIAFIHLAIQNLVGARHVRHLKELFFEETEYLNAYAIAQYPHTQTETDRICSGQ